MRLPLLLAALLGVALPASAGETLDRVKSTGTVTNVLINDYPPFSFIDETNQLAGFDVDVAKAFAGRLGVALKIETPSWEAIVAGGWQGRFDICICSMSPSTDREKVLDFVTQYYSSPAVLAVAADETEIKSIADISGKRVGVGTGSTYEAYLGKTLQIPGRKPLDYPFETPIVIPSDETIAFQNLALGAGVRLDAIVANLATTKERVDATGKVRIVGEPLYGEPNFVSVDKGDAEWNAEVARIIRELKADGTLANISEKWLGFDVTRDDL